MFITVAGCPAGYGYFETTSVVNEDILPALKTAVKAADPNYKLGAPMQIGTMTIKVKADAKISINGRSPILVTATDGIIFDVRGINSIVFLTAVQYNIILSY